MSALACPQEIAMLPRIRAKAFSFVFLSAAPVAAQITHHVGVDDDGETISYTGAPTITSNGRFVAWPSNPAVYVRDRWQGTTVIASVAWNHPGMTTSGEAPMIAADGRYVAFESYANDLVQGDTNGHRDVFVRDLIANTTEIASLASDGTQGDAGSSAASISSDGRFVLFRSSATTSRAARTASCTCATRSRAAPRWSFRSTAVSSTTRASAPTVARSSSAHRTTRWSGRTAMESRTCSCATCRRARTRS
jgi:hypothetical protein